MARINITLDQDEILALLDAGTADADGDGNSDDGAARADVFRRILGSTLNGVLRAESAAQLHAAPYERTGERTDSRNGLRRRSLATRLGVPGLDVPRHRSEPFQTRLFDNYSRSEAALVTTMAEMVVMGVSTRKVARVVEELCGRDVSKSVAGEACKSLDKEVETFRGRPIEGAYPFLAVDATYLKVRVDHRIVSRPLMVAYGTDGRGRREVLALGLGERGDEAAWTGFLRGLAARGMACPLMVTSDANEGIRKAVGAVFPGAAWQRCRFHFSKNIADKAPRTYQAGIRQELTEMSDCKTLEEARQRKDRIVADYRDVADQAATCLDEGFESATGVMRLPAGLRPYMRTNNRLERLNREIKRRTRVIGVFPNTDAAVRMAASVLIEQNDLQRCDRRQLDGTMAVRVPKLKGALFESAVIERYRRREESVEKALIDMYLAGVSTRRVDDISRALCGGRMPSQTLSDQLKKVYAGIDRWRTRPLTRAYPHVFMDGVWHKRSRGGAVENVSILVATGVGVDGRREAVGVAEGM